MRGALVSVAALLAVTAAAPARAQDNREPLPPQTALAPLPGTATDDRSESPTATREEPKPAARPEVTPPSAPVAAIELPPPIMNLPSSAPTIEVPKPTLLLAAELTARLRAEKPSDSLRVDRDAALKVYDDRDGAPIWVTPTGFTTAALALMSEIRAADSYGLSPAAFRLPTQTFAPGSTPTPADLADAEATLSLAALKYARHARGGRLDPVSLTKMLDRKPVIFEPSSVLTELGAAAKPDAYLRGLHPRHPQFEKLRLKYLAVRAGQSVLPPPPQPEPVAEAAPGAKTAKKAPPPPAQPTNAQLERRLLANLEMWRWMPLELEKTYIVNNIPEFTTRLVRDGKLVWSERIVTGKADTPTPVFSDEMDHLVFKPFWNVPESIKWKELQPQLQRSPGALAKVGLRAAYNGKEVDPASVDWNATDLRAFHVFQPPGSGNALGQVKFMFPNKHDVYMHDTPHKALFNNPSRAYSHGCMRVRDPLAFAEQILGPDKGMTRAQIVQLANSGPDNNEIRLTRKIPVHVTYFTTVVDDDGKLKLFNDIYAHEQKVHLGLEGKAHLIQQPRIEAEKAPPRRGGVVTRNTAPTNPVENWMKQVFNF